MIEWFDDLVLGMRFKSPEKRVTREDIKRFASEFDPQAYHLDEAAAEHSVFGGLAASGWHTAAIAMRLAVESRPFGPHPLLGLGVDELRWLAPVRPDDVLHLEGEVVELTPSRSKPHGIARVKWTAFNQRGDPVYTFTPHRAPPPRLIGPGVALARCLKLYAGTRCAVLSATQAFQSLKRIFPSLQTRDNPPARTDRKSVV